MIRTINWSSISKDAPLTFLQVVNRMRKIKGRIVQEVVGARLKVACIISAHMLLTSTPHMAPLTTGRPRNVSLSACIGGK